MKTCSKCGVAKEAGGFGKNKTAKDGLQSNCKTCRRAYREANKAKIAAQIKAWREANPGNGAAQMKAWREANPEKSAAQMKAWREANPEKVTAHRKAYREANPEKVAASDRAWRKANPGKRNAIKAKRRAAKLQRTPPWADQRAIEAIYAHARFLESITGLPHDVDHVVPLQGRLVSGLHVENNLQPIPASVNRSKSNKHEV